MTARNGISIVVEEPKWRRRGIQLSRLCHAARLALSRGPHQQKSAQLTLLLSQDERLRSLNAQFRGKDAPTNVLAFPAAGSPEGYLGDVAVALGAAEREATSAGIGLDAHVLHLTVHGVLHLLGYDHVSEGEARIMERLEIAILHELGLSNPYARAAAE